MDITINAINMEQDQFGVEIKGEDLNFLVVANKIFFRLNAQQLDKLCFEGNSALQDSERNILDKLS